MAELKIPPPNKKQRLFFADHHKYVAFGGARGGGKSWAVRAKAILLCLNHTGITVGIIRRSYPELEANHINPIKKMLPLDIYNYNDSKKRLTFPNGSQIIFRYCSNDKDLNNFQGTEFDILFIDEATQFSENQYKELIACLRGVNDFPKRVYLTCNPGGIGHSWVKRLFIDKRYQKGEHPQEYSFIQSLVSDNKALMEKQPEYKEQLEALPPKLKKAWLEGDWNIFEGQFFEEFRDDPEHYHDRQYTHVIAPFDIPDGWKIYRSFDWGYNKPFSCGWWAVDYDGVVYRILEYYGCNGTANEGVKHHPHQVFADIHRIETEHPYLANKHIIGYADPAIWDAQGGESIAETAAKHQVFFGKGDNKRIPGWMQMHYRFAFDKDGYPMMYIFNTCKDFIRTIPMLQYDEHKPEDIDTRQEDHIADETRYFLMSRPIKPSVEKKADGWKNSPLYQIFGYSKEDFN